jgi:hypothetical protein
MNEIKEIVALKKKKSHQIFKDDIMHRMIV